MFEFKKKPEDFIVNEISNLKISDKGSYAYFKLTKKDMTTEYAITNVSKTLHIDKKKIGYAGYKDRVGITSQLVSIQSGKKGYGFKTKDLELEFVGFGNDQIRIGDLHGNSFEVRVYSDQKPVKIKSIPNYFDQQRFSNNNVEIGKALITKDFKKAAELIIESNNEISFEGFNANDHINKINKISRHLLLLYVHSFQSYLFNKMLSNSIKSKKYILINEDKMNVGEGIVEKIPLLGFTSKISKEYSSLLEKENVKLKDFINRQIPFLTLEGTFRDSFVEIKDLEIIKEKESYLLKFSLPKGSYATIVIKSIFQC